MQQCCVVPHYTYMYIVHSYVCIYMYVACMYMGYTYDSICLISCVIFYLPQFLLLQLALIKNHSKMT